MATMKAVVMLGNGTAEVKTDRPIPKLRDRCVLVETKAVALNPTDWKHVRRANTPGHLSGCDFAGIVEKTGDGYSKKWKVGDRIAGLCHGANELNGEDGSFAEHIAAVADIQIRIPDHMSFEDAATLGVASITCGQGLFSPDGLDLQWPDNPTASKESILIYGGSSAMGTFGIQLAKLAGYTVYTTCSPRNFDLVKSLGATDVFDYNDPECVVKIKHATNNNLKLVWDTISVESSVKICNEVISSGGVYSALLRVKLPRDDVRNTWTIGYTVMGDPVQESVSGYHKADTTEDFNFTVKWNTLVEKLLVEKKLRTHPIVVSDQGFHGILDGMDLMENNKVSGQKLVYVI